MKCNFKKGWPQVLKHIGHLRNYGMFSQTLLSKDSEGDGDPLDIILPSHLVERGQVIPVKLIAVKMNFPLKKMDSIAELDERFPRTNKVLELWFYQYKGKGEILSRGFGKVEEAEKTLNEVSEQFQQSLAEQNQ
tara:strand:- start:84 stop:485 length:402 start_codon:yes stop_codon:yes gene_type:complete